MGEHAGDGGGSTETAAIRDAFSLLAHDIRLDIVLALLDNWAAVYTEPQSYSAVMDAVGMEDSGKFNYHLDKLLGVYVAKVEDGYVPTASATALYRAVTRRAAHHIGLAQTSQCPYCAGHVAADLDPDWVDDTEPAVTMTCETCSWTVGVNALTVVQFVPEVASALDAIGLEQSFLEQRLGELVTDSARSTDPRQVEMTVETAAGAVTIVVDDDLSVVAVEESTA